MKNGLVFVWLVVMAVSLGVDRASAQEGTSAEKTIWDGVYTSAQADRGMALASQSCSGCHTPADWTGPNFIGMWSGGSISGLYATLSTTMPADNPGLLSPREYSDIVAYMLRLNEVPTGETELSSSDADLRSITVTIHHR